MNLISLLVTLGRVVFALGLAVAAADGEGLDTPVTPAEQYQALLKERQNGHDDLSKANTDEERKGVLVRQEKLPLRFLALAEASPKDPIALEALIQTLSWVNSTAFPAGGKNSPGDRALALLLREHVRSDKLGPVCQQIVFGFHKSHEKPAGTPAFYILDPKGVIRYKWAGAPGGKAIDAALEKLIQEAGGVRQKH